MSCQPYIQRTVHKLVGDRVNAINNLLRQRLNQWNASHGFPNPPPRQVPNAALIEAGALLGSVVGSALRPLLSPLQNIQLNTPEFQAVKASENRAFAGWLRYVLSLPPDQRTAAQQEFDGCVTHILSDLISGHLIKHAIKG